MDRKRNNQRPGGAVTYRFRGNGLGVPGLPHELTREQAEKDGILDQLDAAIAAGVYQQITVDAVTTSTEA
jgi:hypothetical protein